jgi:HD-GYP domain-containing protein (c-di-GMP phosphodiesterase class II)
VGTREPGQANVGKLDDQLGEEVVRLRAELAKQERTMRAREVEFGRYIAQLREAVRKERAHADEVSRSYVAAVRALTNAVEARDAYTGKHAERVTAYGLELARLVDPALAGDPEIEFGFLLHDVGKVGVPDAILHKPSGLTRREQGLMQRHPVLGWEIVRHMEFLHGSAQQIVRFHHERWDGDGYPDRLARSDIPLPARIFSVADTLDAITTDRPYRPAASLESARQEIAKEAGRQFDPEAVEALMQIPDNLLDHIRTERVLTSMAAP